MIQTDNFGSFNADILKYDSIRASLIINIADILRDNLLHVSNPDNMFIPEYVDSYVDDIVRNYRWFARITKGETHYW